MATYMSAKGKNRNYWVSVSCPGHGLEVITDMPEQFGLGVTSDWESLLPYSLAGALDSALGSIGKSAVAGVAALAGKMAGKAMNAQSQALSFQIWLGTSPIEFPVKLEFDAYSDAYKDVFLPITLLTAIALPTGGGGGATSLLYPPGPFLGGNVGQGAGYGINLKFGRLMFFQDCILAAASHNFDTRLDKNGYPIAGEIEMTLRTSLVFGHTDLMHAMGIQV